MEYSKIFDPCLALPADERGREDMHKLVLSLRPSLEFTSIGRSMLGRELLAYKIGNGRGRVAIFATHHALESIGCNLLYTFMWVVLGGKAPSFTSRYSLSHLLSLYSYYLVPCLNPDGVELRFGGDTDSVIYRRAYKMSDGDFSLWQANARGVDLNHNYDYRFTKYKRLEIERGISAGATLYSGEFAESEPESRAAASFVRALAPLAVMSIHSQGEEIFFSPSSARRTADRLSSLTGYSVREPADTAAFGGLCDYTGWALSIPSFTIEVGRGRNPLPESELFRIFPRVFDALLSLPTLV